MNTHDAKTLPLNVLLGYLTMLNSDLNCTCDCQYETYLGNNCKIENKPAVIYSKSAMVSANTQNEECKRNGCSWVIWETASYEDCPQRIAYERIKAVLDKENPKHVIYHPISDWVCPICDYHIVDLQRNYCPNCGQRLEW